MYVFGAQSHAFWPRGSMTCHIADFVSAFQCDSCCNVNARIYISKISFTGYSTIDSNLKTFVDYLFTDYVVLGHGMHELELSYMSYNVTKEWKGRRMSVSPLFPKTSERRKHPETSS